MLKELALGLVILLFHTLIFADPINYQQIGDTTYSSDGATYQRIGSSIYSSDGTSYQQIGDSV